jgi:hypothetical protein
MKKVLAYLPVVLSLGALGQPFQSPALKKIYRLDGH